jgi:hypothetical protein
MAQVKGTQLKKHAEVIEQLHAYVRKQAEAQSTVVGTPGGDTKQKSVSEETDHIDKNEVKPENNKNEFKQEGSKEEAGKVVSSGGVKTSSDKLNTLSNEILSLLQKHSEEAQKNVEGTPGKDTDTASPEESTEHIDKNKVTPENNTNDFKQEGSKEEAGKTVSDAPVKSATISTSEVKTTEPKVAEDKLAAKIATYNVGAQLVADLLKATGFGPTEKSAAQAKESGARDYDILINQVAEALNLQKESTIAPPTKPAFSEPTLTEKEAEDLGVAYLEEIYNPTLTLALQEKVASLEEKFNELFSAKTAEERNKEEKLAKEAKEKADDELAAKIASAVSLALDKKLSEPAK